MEWSKYQKAIFDFTENHSGHGCVQACAGSGKSTTAVQAIQRIGNLYQGLFTSFTRTIVEDLGKKLTEIGLKNVEAKTYNAFGARLIYRNMKPAPKLLTDYQNQKTDTILKYDIFNGELTHRYHKGKAAIFRLVSLFKSLAITEVIHASERFDEIVDYYDIELPKVEDFKQLVLDTFHLCMQRTDIIDYDDQKWFPILFNWPIPQVDFLVIDEYQDTSPIESQLMLRACIGGRVLAFGDSNQAIFSFKGTTPNSMAEFITNKRAKPLPLSICYRCSKSVVRAAQELVPEIEWSPTAIEGCVTTRSKNDFKKACQRDDMVIGRTTEDLVRSVTGFLEENRGAYIVGKEYGTQLLYFIEKVNPSDNTLVDTFGEAMEMYFNTQYQALTKARRENLAMQLESRVETLRILIMNCHRIQELITKIGRVFGDAGNGIQHMTIHKSKGLERKNVWLLRPDKLPHPRAKLDHQIAEERRLKYVAITRAQENLSYVVKDRGEK